MLANKKKYITFAGKLEMRTEKQELLIIKL